MGNGHSIAGHPVDVASGTVYSMHEDVRIPGKVQLTWERRYSTSLLESVPTSLGPGWTTRYFATLTRDKEGYKFVSPEGHEEVFQDPEGSVERGDLVRNLGTFKEICKRANRYIVTRWSVETGRVERYIFKQGAFGKRWPLASIENVKGQGLDLVYNAADQLTDIRQRRAQRSLHLDYNNDGRVRTVTLIPPNKQYQVLVRYEYDAQGRLRAAYNALGHADRYEYDTAGRMRREIRKDGGVFSFKYDDQGRCISTSGLDNYVQRALRYLDHVGWTEVTNSLGYLWRFKKLPSGQIESQIDPMGGVKTTEYDELGRVIGITDALEGRTEYAYDAVGNRIQIVHPDGSTHKFEYNQDHLVTRVVNALGAEWTFEYDSRNHLVTVSYPTGFEKYMRWDDQGCLIEASNSDGGFWYYRNDSLGQLTEIRTRDQSIAQFDYDDWGLRSSVLDAAGEKRYQRNAAGQLVRVDHPDGSYTQYTYDAGGNRKQIISSVKGVTTFRYGQCCGRIVEVESPDGRRMQYEWGTEANRLEAIIDDKGERYTFKYNAAGYVQKEVFPNGRVLTYDRNAKGEVIRRTNGAGEVTEYKRDAVGRILTATYFDGSQVEFEYNAAGQVVQAKNKDAMVQMERDLCGHRVKEMCNGYEIESEYNQAGMRTTRRSSLGLETTYAFDQQGHITQVGLSADDVIQVGYDQQGREMLRQFPGGMVQKRSYDLHNRLTEQQLTAVKSNGTAPGSSPLVVHRRYRYNREGNLEERWDQRWGKTSFRYNTAGNLTERKPEKGVHEQFKYDANGNVVSSTKTYVLSADDFASGARPEGIAALERYLGPGNQVLRKGDTVFTYDGDGRLIEKIQDSTSEQPQVWTYKWNPVGLLAEVITPTGEQWRYSYDAFGRRIGKQGPGKDTTYVWDGNAIMHEIPAPDAAPITWTFWPDNFVPIAKQEQRDTYYVIDDQLGTPRELVDNQGHIAWSAHPSSWGELDHAAPALTTCNLRFQGQWFDEESGLHYNHFRYYDPGLGSFISMDPVPFAGGVNGYLYVRNPINWIDPFGLQPVYYPLDEHGRATGAYAEVHETGGGTSASHDPPGLNTAHPDHHQRSHLIADSLGGSGSDPGNIVALTSGSNHSANGMTPIENTIRRHVDADPNNSVVMEVTVTYGPDVAQDPTPQSVHIYALDQDGNVLVDETVENGHLQNHSGCNCGA